MPDEVEKSDDEETEGCPPWLSVLIILASAAVIWVALSWFTGARNPNSVLPPTGGLNERMGMTGQ